MPRQVDDEGLRIQDSVNVQFSPILTYDLTDGGQERRLGGSNDEAQVQVVCAVIFLSSLDIHEGTCRLPTRDKIPLAGSFRLSVSLTSSGELVGGSDYGVNVTSCPAEWFFHRPSGSCRFCDESKSLCRGGKELPVPRPGYWSDLEENAELGFVYVTIHKNGCKRQLQILIRQFTHLIGATASQIHVQLPNQLPRRGKLPWLVFRGTVRHRRMCRHLV